VKASASSLHSLHHPGCCSAMEGDRDDYKVGYKSPPIATRFKKGQSGNPSGKPKKTSDKLDLGRIPQAIDHEEMVVEIDGKSRRMSKVEIHFWQLFNKALRGNLKAARLIAKMAGTYFGPEAEAAPVTRFIVVPDAMRIREAAKKDAVQKRSIGQSEGSTKNKHAADLGSIHIS
jgi:hypothetical protein